MGRAYAAGFADAVNEGMISLDAALSVHLSNNHYPPVPASMVPVCKRAIASANKGKYDGRIRLPEGIRYKGNVTAPVWAIIEQHHLESFLSLEEEY